jgi:hypothetical protein
MLGRIIDRLIDRFSRGPDVLAEVEDRLAAAYGPEEPTPGGPAEPPIDLADPQYHEPHEPRLELVEFNGASTDVAWMTYNHDTGECLIQYLDHGKEDRLYSYQDFPYEEFQKLMTGEGPFPRFRDPRYYQKLVSAGQRANFYVRNDHRDDLYEYERLS